MSKAVNRLQFVPDHAKLFDGVQDQALMKTDVEAAGEVLLVSKVVDKDGNVDVLLLFPTAVDTAADDKLAVGERYQPTGIRFTLNAFLNAARMVAVHHQAVISKGSEMPEAMTHDHVQAILGAKGHNNG